MNKEPNLSLSATDILESRRSSRQTLSEKEFRICAVVDFVKPPAAGKKKQFDQAAADSAVSLAATTRRYTSRDSVFWSKVGVRIIVYDAVYSVNASVHGA